MKETIVANGILHEVPDDIKNEIKADISVLEIWNNLTSIQRNEWICWVTIVKKSETREERLGRMMEDLKNGKRQPCCWPGCPHRKPSSQKWFKQFQI
ncbi:MAG: YdeI/OmpD-associated family protein [Ignavibacteria bacterium]|nr:YdeI/OmpD-associated family protein [Ignavibacteria bacterium]